MKEYLTGKNPEILALREKMPEPSQYEDEFYRTSVVLEIGERYIPIIFQKVLVRTEGVSFQAWFCLMDKRIYI